MKQSSKILNLFLVLMLLFSNFSARHIYANDETNITTQESTETIEQSDQSSEVIEEVASQEMENKPDENQDFSEDQQPTEDYQQEELDINQDLEEDTQLQENTEEIIEEEVVSEYYNIDNPYILEDFNIIDNIKIFVSGEFEEEAHLFVQKVQIYKELSENNVAEQVSFDIKVLNNNNEEIQPINKVNVSFEFVEISQNLDVEVFHEEEPVETIVEENVVTVETDGFSIYTVEFTYNNKEYVLTGDYWIKLSELLEQLDLTGNIESWQVSNSTLFDICLGNDEEPSFDYYSDEEGNEFNTPTNIGDIPYLVSFEPFDTTEWLKVTIDGIEYEITVTDSQVIIDGVTQNIPGVTQGEYISNFTSDMQVATIFIDETKVNQLPASGNSAIGKILNGYDEKGFSFGDSYNYSTRVGNVLYFDASKWTTEIDNGDGTTTTKTGFFPRQVDGYNHYWLDLPGDIVEYVFKDGAQSSTGALYDVVITFSDIRIALQRNINANFLTEVNKGYIKYSTFAGNAMLIGQDVTSESSYTRDTVNTGNGRYGLMYNANIRVVEDADAPTRITVPGTFIYPMVDIDVNRAGFGSFSYFYESSKYKNYSEQIQITSNNFGDVFIPFQASEEDTTKYKASIDNKEDGLLFYPRVSGDSDTLLSGFVTLANNSRGGINVRGWAAGSSQAGVETYLLTGGKVGDTPTVINHKIKSSTKTLKHNGTYEENNTKGGTIETTQAGNKDGTLDDGTTILGPNVLTVASGETVVYTMTPNVGYKANVTYVKKGSLDYAEGGEISPTPVYDSDGVIKYYTFEFAKINEDNAIHIEWEPDVYPLEVTKTTTDDISGTFDYTLELSTRKTTKARIYNISIVAGIATTVDEETGVSTTEPYYYFFNTGDEFVVNGITIPTGSFTNGGTGVGLDAICDVLIGTTQENPITVQLGSELGTLSTEAATSVADQIQELLDEEYTSAALDAITYTFSSPEKTEIIPWAFEELPDGVEGSNGTYTFKVANGETFTIPNMPNGVYYTLTEVAKDGWTCKSTNPINTRIKNEDAAFNYLNEYNAYDLVIKKETVDNEEGSFSFVIDIDKEVEIPAQSIDFSIAASASGGQISYNLINNKPQFTVEYNGQHIDIPAGTYIYGTDETIDSFINMLTGLDDVDSVDVKLNGEDGIASTEETETLASKVQALLDEGYSMFALEPVAFNISSLPRIDRVGLEFDTLPVGVVGTNGLYRFTLTNGQSVTFSGIPHGYEYEVKEAEDIEWELIKIEESSTAEILQVEFEDLSTITPIMEVNGHIVTTGGGQQPGDHFQPQAYSSQTYMRLRYSTDGKTNEFTSTNHTVSYDDVIEFIYPQAAIMPDGTKKDVLVTVSNISITKPETVSNMNVNFKGAIFRATGGPALAIRSFGTNSTQRTPSSYTVNETIKVSLASSSKNEVFKVMFDGNEYEGNGHDGIIFTGQISGSSASTTVKPITLAKQENIDDMSANEVIENPESPEYFNTADGDSMVTYTNKKVPKYDLTVKKDTENNAPGTFNFTGKIYREETHPGVNQTVQIEASIIDGQPRYVLHNTQQALEIPEVGFIPAGSYVYGGSNQILNGIIENLINNVSSENPYEFTIDEQDWTVSTDTETPIGVQIEDLINQGQTDVSFEPIHYTYVSEPKVVKHYFVPEPLPEGVTENDGVLSFSLENGQSITFEEILKGHKFEIIEQAKEGWRNIEKVNDTGVLEEDTVAKFVNKKIINLTIKKEADVDTGEEFDFEVKIWEETFVPDESSNVERVLAVFTRNQMEPVQQEVGSNYQYLPDFVLPSDSEAPQYITDYANNLPEESRFESAQTLRLTDVPVTELIRTGLLTEFGNNKYEVVMSDWMDGTSWASGVHGKERDVYFKKMKEVDTFMDLSDLGGKDNDDGSYTFKLKSGESLTVNEIPYGYKYEIYEIDSQGNRVSVGDVFNTKWQLKSATNTSGTLEESTASVFTNEIKRVSLDIKKETVGNVPGTFEFKIKVWEQTDLPNGSSTKEYIDLSEQLGEPDEDGYYHFTLNNNESLTIPNLPYGYMYEVIEIEQDGWRLVEISGRRWGVEYMYDSQTLVADKEVVFTNMSLPTLTIAKEVTGNMGDKYKEFEFEIKIWKDKEIKTKKIGTMTIDYDNPENSTLTDLAKKIGTYITTDYIVHPPYNSNLSFSNDPSGEEVYNMYDFIMRTSTVTEDNMRSFNLSNDTDMRPYKAFIPDIQLTAENSPLEVPIYLEDTDNLYPDNLEVLSSYTYRSFYDLNDILDSNAEKLTYSHTFTMDDFNNSCNAYWHGLDSTDVKDCTSIKLDVPELSDFIEENSKIKITTVEGTIFKYTVENIAEFYGFGEYELVIDNNEDVTGLLQYLFYGTDFTVSYEKWKEDPSLYELLIGKTATIEITLPSDTYTFKLKHNESIEIPNIPYGYEYEIVEKDYSDEGYKQSVDGKEGREVSGELTEDKNHLFENRNQAAVPTEVRITQFGVVALIVLGIIFVIKRRRTLED